MGEVAKKEITKLGCEKYFSRVTWYLLSTAGDALNPAQDRKARQGLIW
jgi:hypothetical protein